MPHEKVLGFARKAAGFAVRPLVDVPTLPGGRAGRLVEQAIEGSTSPIGIASTLLLPVTGGASLGLRGGAGVAARLATRGAAEVGTSAAGGLAAEEVAKRVQNAPGVIKYGAPLVAGFAGSAGAAAGLNRAALRLEPGQEFGFASMAPAPRVAQGGVDIPASPATSYETLLPLSQSRSLLDPSMARASVTTEVPAVRARENIGTENVLRRDFSKIKRGRDALLSRIGMEVRLGRLTPGAAPTSVAFVKSIPEPYLENVASTFSSASAKSAGGVVSGRYDPETSIVTIFNRALNGDPHSAQGTIIHEVAHHLEQFLDDKQYKAIQDTWKATTKPRYDQYDAAVRDIASRAGVSHVGDLGLVKQRIIDIKPPKPPPQQNLGWTSVEGGLIDTSKAREELLRLDGQFTYAERGGINEWFAEAIREAELTRQSGIVPSRIREFIRKTGDIIRGYNEQAAPDVVRRLQAGR